MMKKSIIFSILIAAIPVCLIQGSILDIYDDQSTSAYETGVDYLDTAAGKRRVHLYQKYNINSTRPLWESDDTAIQDTLSQQLRARGLYGDYENKSVGELEFEQSQLELQEQQNRMSVEKAQEDVDNHSDRYMKIKQQMSILKTEVINDNNLIHGAPELLPARMSARLQAAVDFPGTAIPGQSLFVFSRAAKDKGPGDSSTPKQKSRTTPAKRKLRNKKIQFLGARARIGIKKGKGLKKALSKKKSGFQKIKDQVEAFKKYLSSRKKTEEKPSDGNEGDPAEEGRDTSQEPRITDRERRRKKRSDNRKRRKKERKDMAKARKGYAAQYQKYLLKYAGNEDKAQRAMGEYRRAMRAKYTKWGANQAAREDYRIKYGRHMKTVRAHREGWKLYQEGAEIDMNTLNKVPGIPGDNLYGMSMEELQQWHHNKPDTLFSALNRGTAAGYKKMFSQNRIISLMRGSRAGYQEIANQTLAPLRDTIQKHKAYDKQYGQHASNIADYIRGWQEYKGLDNIREHMGFDENDDVNDENLITAQHAYIDKIIHQKGSEEPNKQRTLTYLKNVLTRVENKSLKEELQNIMNQLLTDDDKTVTMEAYYAIRKATQRKMNLSNSESPFESAFSDGKLTAGRMKSIKEEFRELRHLAENRIEFTAEGAHENSEHENLLMGPNPENFRILFKGQTDKTSIMKDFFNLNLGLLASPLLYAGENIANTLLTEDTFLNNKMKEGIQSGVNAGLDINILFDSLASSASKYPFTQGILSFSKLALTKNLSRDNANKIFKPMLKQYSEHDEKDKKILADINGEIVPITPDYKQTIDLLMSFSQTADPSKANWNNSLTAAYGGDVGGEKRSVYIPDRINPYSSYTEPWNPNLKENDFSFSHNIQDALKNNIQSLIMDKGINPDSLTEYKAGFEAVLAAQNIQAIIAMDAAAELNIFSPQKSLQTIVASGMINSVWKVSDDSTTHAMVKFGGTYFSPNVQETDSSWKKSSSNPIQDKPGQKEMISINAEALVSRYFTYSASQKVALHVYGDMNADFYYDGSVKGIGNANVSLVYNQQLKNNYSFTFSAFGGIKYDPDQIHEVSFNGGVDFSVKLGYEDKEKIE